MQYTVIATIQSANLDSGDPVQVKWYDGDSLACAIAALASAATCYTDGSTSVPESVQPKTLSVRMDVSES